MGVCQSQGVVCSLHLTTSFCCGYVRRKWIIGIKAPKKSLLWDNVSTAVGHRPVFT